MGDFGDIQPMFNGSLHTLLRVDELLKDCSKYRVNDNIIGYKSNLREVLKEGQGFLKGVELKKALKDWGEIEEYEIREDEYNLIYDSELLEKLDKFDFWIRLKLHRHNLTFAQNRKGVDGMAKIINRLGLNENREKQV